MYPSFTVSTTSFWTSLVIDFINPTALYMCCVCFARTRKQAENITECFPNHASHFSWAPSSRFRYSPGKLKWVGGWSQLFQTESVCLCGWKWGQEFRFCPDGGNMGLHFLKPTVWCCTVHLMYWCAVCFCKRFYKIINVLRPAGSHSLPSHCQKHTIVVMDALIVKFGADTDA